MNNHVCPWYIGYLLLNPLRRFSQSPSQIVSPHLEEGMQVLEVGPGMGFFSLPLARIVGETGRVFCVDMQEKMIGGLRRRVAKAGLLNRIELRVCSSASLQIDDLTGMIDFALAFAVVHETSDAQHFLSEIYKSLKGAGRLLISEPKGHVNVDEFDVTLSTARNVGFKIVNTLDIKRSHSILLEKD